MAVCSGVYLLIFSGCVAASQRNQNIFVSGISSACGDSSELLRASSGVITSPGWPFQYPPRLNCSWNIRGRPGDTITLSFQDFELQSSHRCSSDWMSISSYKNLDGLRVCGSSLPPPYISSQDHVWIHFRSDEALTGKGFRLSYVTGKADVSSCDVDHFHCSNGKCIPDWWRCNSMDECGDNSDEDLCVDSPFSFQPCSLNQFPCLSRYTRIYTCLPHSLRCDGSIDCQDLGDEIDCDVPTCGDWLRNFYGSFSSPNYPDFYPPGSNCTWLIDTGDHRKVILRFTDFKLDGTGYGDYVKVYDGLEENPRRLLRVLTAFDSRAPLVVVSSSGQLRIHFYADKINAARGFNVTYQVDGFCLPWELPCGGNWGCYTEQQRCDGYWHCPNGRDELNCSTCQEEEFPCSRNGACYPRSDRCNYQNRCPNGSDEKNCFFCQPGNFHCKNNRCVFESWVCDAQDDCGDGSDEESCPVVVPTRVITAAVIGSLVCGLLLVIALGCTCKLYSLRMFERRSFETQLSRVEAELLRREAPPSYGQLIAQGLIPPVEDFPVCSGNQASVLENLRLAVRSQLGFTTLRLPSACRHSNLWRSIFNFSRSRQSASLALVSADLEDSAGTGSSGSDLLSPDSDDTDTESDRGRERVIGAVAGPVAPLPHKTPPSSSVAMMLSTTPINLPDTSRATPSPAGPVTMVTANPDAICHSDSSEVRAPSTSGLQRLAQSLRQLARNLLGSSQNPAWTNHSPLRQLDTGRTRTESTERRGSEEDEEDVELLIPDLDSSSLLGGVRQPLLEPALSPDTARAPRQHRANGTQAGRDGPCEHCGKVHTARIPDACLEFGGKTESSDDELLQLC
ncbi:low-density lipoprotein receptor-related protein 12-like [Entelurus aequoreus]|uniref:low-density lipoprotein receptor-related protein 12-like n=1 Tax=Entelurus aequoreus TaxID=161455 RepID=UPI002B1E4D71|nr:low-density lipoprotein receptor-related protein 12-like [Entelurus aequoreus]XP_061905267.1 low-density lipoprotein receptor-related protein 12-like [Entelurus aequoreus]XP_061905268.1 low-density lipoprotein receptor-related protein 12-like [Entelurus aequoreus]